MPRSAGTDAIRAVAFDVDGTLYPKRAYFLRMALAGLLHPLFSWAYNRARVRYRKEQAATPTVPETREGYKRRMGMLLADILHQQGRETALVEKMERVFYHSWEILYRHVPQRRGMRAVVKALKEKGYTIAVMSDFPLACKLEALGIAPYVDVAFSTEDIGYLKPDRRTFIHLLSCIGLPPEAVLYVGDSYPKDVLGAKGSGMHTCLIGQAERKGKLYPEAEHVIPSFKELALLL